MKLFCQIYGVAELTKRLNAMPEGVRAAWLSALKAGAEPMRSQAAANAPRSDEAPHIADNIQISVAKKAGARDIATVAIGPSKDFVYGMYLERGTVKMSAQPYLRPAFDSHGDRSLGIIGRALWDVLRRQSGAGVDAGTVGGRFE